MSMQVQIDRIEYTPRDRLLPNRNIYILTLECIVPDDSYLITASMPSELPNISDEIKSIVKELDKKSWNNSDEFYYQLLREVGRIENIKKNKERNFFPRINDQYIIPGSTLKGAVRSRIEYKLSPKNNKSLSCYIVEDNFYPQYAVNHIKFWGNDVVISRPKCNITDYSNKVCWVCNIFGSPSLSSLVSFSDAYLVDGGIVKLNDLGYEAAKPGSKFNLKITCFNFDKIMLGLLFLGLELYSKSPIIIGILKYKYNKKLGSLYKGKYSFGLLRFELKEIEVIDHRCRRNENVNEIVNECKRELENSNLNQYIDWNRGVIS
jgi:RAMP superfamily.